MRIHVVLAVILLAGAVASAQGKTVTRDDVTITTSRTKEYNEAVASGIIDADAETIWAVLTDFDNHEKYMPNVISSAVAARNGHTLMIEKIIKIAFRRIPMTLKTTLVEINRVLSWEQVKGPIKLNRGIYVIKPNGKGCHVTYTVQLKHGYYIPRWIQRKMTEKAMTKLFKVIRREAARRIKVSASNKVSL